MSSDKTTELDLHKWAATDYVQRTEFNDNFAKIDEHAAGVTEQLAQTDIKANNINIDIMFPPAPLVAAVSDGVSDAALAIRNIVNHAHTMGGGTVIIPQKTFLLSNLDSLGVLIPAKSNVNIIGLGVKSVLKLADGMNQSSNFELRVIRNEESDGLNNAIFRDFMIDMNGSNNISANIATRGNIALGAKRGSNIVIDNVTVLNNAGRQCFSFGNNVAPHTIKDITIQNCTFENFGNGVIGNTGQTDHSCIYVQADRCIIQNNRFINPDGLYNQTYYSTGTAIECHASNAFVTDNYGKNLKNALNIVATVTDQVNSIYQNNVFENIQRGAEVWVYNNFKMSNILLYKNTFIQSYKDAVLDINRQVQTTLDSIYIKDNIFEYVGPRLNTHTWGGINIRNVKYLEIEGCTFKSLSSQAIYSSVGTGSSEMYIRKNRIIDCGNTDNTGASLKTAIALFGESVKRVVIEDNIIENTGSNMDYGIDMDRDIPGLLKISNNEIISVPNHIKIGQSKTYGEININHRGNARPTQIRASIGSVWYDKVNNITHSKSKFAISDTGWVKTLSGSVAPTTGVNVVDDRCINANRTELGESGSKYIIKEWTCLTAGTPGVWIPEKTLTGN